MKIKSLKVYPDKELKRTVDIGEILDVTKERGKYLISISYAEEVKKSKKE